VVDAGTIYVIQDYEEEGGWVAGYSPELVLKTSISDLVEEFVEMSISGSCFDLQISEIRNRLSAALRAAADRLDSIPSCDV